MANYFDQFDTANVPRIRVTPNRAVPEVGRALLDTIAGSESPGYDVMYGGGRFEDFTDHPRTPVPIKSGPNAGRNSTAAGRYQFLARTWDEVKNEAGLPDFSPESQDIGAWHLADKTYRQKTGRDLAKDLEASKGNPNAVAGIGRYLSGVWTSLPGGIEPNSMTRSFAERYQAPAGSTDISSQATRPTANFFDQFDATELPDTGGRFTDTPGQSFRTAREGESPAVAGAGEAAGRGFFRGVTFNFIDELNALASAGGIDPNDTDGMRVLGALVKGAYKKFGGDPEAEAAYRARLSQEREKDTRLQEQQPGASLTGEVGGALATIPFGGAAARGATLPQRIGQGMATGAAYGGAAGAGEGTDLRSRAGGAAVGGLTGGALGGVAPVAVEGAVKAGQGINKLAQPLVQAVRGVRDVDAEAARRIVAAQSADLAQPTSRSGLTPGGFQAARAGGQPAVVGDIGGENVRGLARSAADTSASGREALEAVTSERFKTQSPRTVQFLKETFDFPDSPAALDRIKEAAARQNAPAYRKAYSEGAGGLWDEALENLTQDPLVQRSIRLAFAKGQNRAAVEGLPPVRNPFVQNPATNTLELRTNPDGSRVLPNLQFWDHVKRGLDKINTQESRAVAEALRSHLDELVPSYGEARAGAAKFFGAKDALEAGANFATMTGTNALNVGAARKALANMVPADRKLFETGLVSNLIAKVESLKEGQDIVKQLFNSEFAKKQLELGVGKARADMIEAHLLRERAMDMLRGAVSGNSKTAQYLHQLGFAGGQAATGAGIYAATTGNLDYGSVLAGAIFAGAGRKIDQRVARRVGEMLASNDPAILRKGLHIVARSDTLRRALRSFDLPATRVSGQQAPGLPALQSMGTGRAENE